MRPLFIRGLVVGHPGTANIEIFALSLLSGAEPPHADGIKGLRHSGMVR